MGTMKLPKFSYNENQMNAAVDAVKRGVPMRKAAKDFKVPRATLFDKVKGRTPLRRKMGRNSYLTEKEEKDLVE